MLRRENEKTVLYNLYLLKTLALRLSGNGGLDEETLKIFTLFLDKNGGTNGASFQGVCMNDIPMQRTWFK